MLLNILLGLSGATLLTALIALVKQFANSGQQKAIDESLAELRDSIIEKMHQLQLEQAQKAADLKEQLQTAFSKHRSSFDERQMETLKILQDTLQKGAADNRQQVKEALTEYASLVGKRVDALTQTTENKLKEINNQVEKRLTEGFEKTNATFGDVIKRLALIDAAQQKITELSTNVVSLQEILHDKRSRGAFGEVQLAALIQNMIPEQNYSLQHTLSNKRRPDCMLFLPEPTGNVAVDAKFPLENYRIIIDTSTSEADKTQAMRQFKLDIRKHIQDISEKYIIPGETAEGAVMFIPSESVFAEIHAHHGDLVEYAQQANVWLVSPTTMMAILTTARAVLKDAATRKQVHIIQQHLRMLSNDFDRFQKRMDNLAKHVNQAHEDVEKVHISSRKISSRFSQIEAADLSEAEPEETITGPVEVEAIEG